MRKGLAPIVLAFALVGAGAADADSLPPPNSPLPVIAMQFLREVGELKLRPNLTVRCVNFSTLGDPGSIIRGAALLRGNVLYLSTRYVCTPLAGVWRTSPIFTGSDRSSISLAGVDAIETVAHEWFHTQGIANEERTECHAVRYTWKWLQRSDLAPMFLSQLKRHLIDNSRRPPGHKIPATCLGA
jgi:hypothetical protein